MKNLQDFTIFLHGPSGSGKGEVQRKLTEKYTHEGYDVRYISSGDLYREAFAKPEIAELMKRGIYFDTLEAIIPGLQERYQDFLQEWQKKNGRVVLILDGLIRRGEFTNKEGQIIPSQIQQIAEAFHTVRSHIQNADSEESPNINDEIVNSKHILIDINPFDAEYQMRVRANKEVQNIKLQLEGRVATGNFPFESTTFLYLLLDRLSEIINTELHTDEDYELLAAEVQQIRKDIALSVGKEETASFSSAFRDLGIVTQLRDDDVSPIGRRTRIGNYVSFDHTPEGIIYSPGFAAQALMEGLGYDFHSDGTLTSTRENCKVIENGKSRGIQLEVFQRECEKVSGQFYEQTEAAREIKFSGLEGNRKSKEY